MTVDLHQHLWPPPLIAALRGRTRPPRLDGWTLVLDAGGAALDPAAHDVAARATQSAADGLELVAVSPGATLGLDRLPVAEAARLADAWHEGALALPAPFRTWATGTDPDALADALDAGALGLELPAHALAMPDALDALEPLLTVLEAAGRTLFLHPGAGVTALGRPWAGEPQSRPLPDGPGAAGRPTWWPRVVDDVTSLHAAWWAWADGGRERFPRLPVLFAALAGLGPLHGERRRAPSSAVDPLTFLDTSGYGAHAVDATVRVLGVDGLVHGSDRPSGRPADLRLDPSAHAAITSRNPRRLLSHALQEVPT